MNVNLDHKDEYWAFIKCEKTKAAIAQPKARPIETRWHMPFDGHRKASEWF